MLEVAVACRGLSDWPLFNVTLRRVTWRIRHSCPYCATLIITGANCLSVPQSPRQVRNTGDKIGQLTTGERCNGTGLEWGRQDGRRRSWKKWRTGQFEAHPQEPVLQSSTRRGDLSGQKRPDSRSGGEQFLQLAMPLTTHLCFYQQANMASVHGSRHSGAINITVNFNSWLKRSRACGDGEKQRNERNQRIKTKNKIEKKEKMFLFGHLFSLKPTAKEFLFPLLEHQVK